MVCLKSSKTDAIVGRAIRTSLRCWPRRTLSETFTTRQCRWGVPQVCLVLQRHRDWRLMCVRLFFFESPRQWIWSVKR